MNIAISAIGTGPNLRATLTRNEFHIFKAFLLRSGLRTPLASGSKEIESGWNRSWQSGCDRSNFALGKERDAIFRRCSPASPEIEQLLTY